MIDYIKHQFVYHVPLAILASALGVMSVLFLSMALVLDSISTNHKFNFELRWLAYSGREYVDFKEVGRE